MSLDTNIAKYLFSDEEPFATVRATERRAVLDELAHVRAEDGEPPTEAMISERLIPRLLARLTPAQAAQDAATVAGETLSKLDPEASDAEKLRARLRAADRRLDMYHEPRTEFREGDLLTDGAVDPEFVISVVREGHEHRMTSKHPTETYWTRKLRDRVTYHKQSQKRVVVNLTLLGIWCYRLWGVTLTPDKVSRIQARSRVRRNGRVPT